jgi:hypothetical protein
MTGSTGRMTHGSNLRSREQTDPTHRILQDPNSETLDRGAAPTSESKEARLFSLASKSWERRFRSKASWRRGLQTLTHLIPIARDREKVESLIGANALLPWKRALVPLETVYVNYDLGLGINLQYGDAVRRRRSVALARHDRFKNRPNIAKLALGAATRVLIATEINVTRTHILPSDDATVIIRWCQANCCSQNRCNEEYQCKMRSGDRGSGIARMLHR